MMKTLPAECCFCRQSLGRDQLCFSIRKDNHGVLQKGALCKGCIRSFILDMAYTEPEEFERMIQEARDAPDKEST